MIGGPARTRTWDQYIMRVLRETKLTWQYFANFNFNLILTQFRTQRKNEIKEIKVYV